MELEKIRNFSIIAHIDHGKSTLADRMLELTGTVEKRKMVAQVLDSMELEREKGITIKMQPVRMAYTLGGVPYILNLIDTPGHIDFSYEVSRAIRAVEGAILLVDATQGIQAQTLTTLSTAKESSLTIIPVINKIDLPSADVPGVAKEVVALLGCSPEEVVLTSGKTGEGLSLLLEEVIRRFPPPKDIFVNTQSGQALVFDFEYSSHRGVIVFVRVFDGSFRKGDRLIFAASGESFEAVEVGIFSPEKKSVEVLGPGEIGYIVTGIKKIGKTKVGDTLTFETRPLSPLSGYMEPKPVVWASVYPESQDDFVLLRQALERLKLSDASVAYEEEVSTSLGRGFKCGFLGMLHLEIISERLKREFGLNLVVTLPTVSYEIESLETGKRETVRTAAEFPDDSVKKVTYEPWISAKIITPPEYLGSIMQIFHDHEVVVGETEVFGDKRNSIDIEMPLRELMRNFFDKLKSVSSGFASISYQLIGMRVSDVVRLDVIIANELELPFSRVVARRRVEAEAEAIVDKLKNVLPRQLFDFKIQAQALGRIIASRSMSGVKKDVAGYLYGGDITRKMKLREKQKKGKKKMKGLGRVNIPQDVFLEVMKSE
ncbi:MAG: elongation factor 4 [Candidatus Vogelbacteria bacterium]|nr:elongation factor 4 [Candidatus Vogelbacteria bacterium]